MDDSSPELEVKTIIFPVGKLVFALYLRDLAANNPESLPPPLKQASKKIVILEKLSLRVS